MLNQAISCMFRSTPSKDDIPWQPPRKVRQNFHLFSADRRWFLRSWSRITAVFKRLSRHRILMQFRFVMMTWAIGPMPLGPEETHKFQGEVECFPPQKSWAQSLRLHYRRLISKPFALPCFFVLARWWTACIPSSCPSLEGSIGRTHTSPWRRCP